MRHALRGFSVLGLMLCLTRISNQKGLHWTIVFLGFTKWVVDNREAFTDKSKGEFPSRHLMQGSRAGVEKLIDDLNGRR